MRSIVVLISGEGTNMRRIVEWCEKGRINGKVIGVISDKVNALGLAWAKEKNIPTACIEYTNRNKDAGEAKIHQQLVQWGADFVALAGYMRILQQSFVAKWQNSMVNLHPSLLPNYKGLNPYARAIENKERYHGCSIHVVIEELDAGQVIAQAKLEIRPDEEVASLAARTRDLEHQLLPRIVKLICEGSIRLQNGIAYFRCDKITTPLMLDDLLSMET